MPNQCWIGGREEKHGTRERQRDPEAASQVCLHHGVMVLPFATVAHGFVDRRPGFPGHPLATLFTLGRESHGGLPVARARDGCGFPTPQPAIEGPGADESWGLLSVVT
jgi:hypothetical protein